MNMAANNKIRRTLSVAGLAIVAFGMAAPAVAQSGRYVAMGSSFAAGPGITQPAGDPTDNCRRSADNYAHQLARRRDLALTDVSCSGATTLGVLAPWNGHPAQIDAIMPGTTLVTVTIGGNDVGYIGGLTAGSCRSLAARKGDAAGLAKCPIVSRPTEAAYASLATSLRQIATEVRARAPRAKLVFVDYLTILPAAGVCAATPLSPQDADASRETARRLMEITRQAAMESGANDLAASSLSIGHDVCGKTPWMNGFPTPAGVAPYHPNLAGMTAVAEALDKSLPH
jgi:lysophospholipase L1-like esterase